MTSLRNCHKVTKQGLVTKACFSPVVKHNGYVARAILKNAPILVLDEATAFADPENEHKMQMALQSLIKNKTVIVIAHRLSSIVSAHQIVVMKEGRIVQCGIHDVLSTAEGVYKNMWDAYTNAYQWTLNKN